MSTETENTPSPVLENTDIHRSLAGRMLRLYGILLLIPTLLIPGLCLVYLYRASLISQVDQQTQNAARLGLYLEDRIENQATEVLVVSQLPELRRLTNADTPGQRALALETLQDHLESFLSRHHENFSGLQLLTHSGQSLLNLGSAAAGTEDRTDYTTAPWFTGANHLAAIRGKKTPVYISHSKPEDPIRFSTVLLKDSGITFGVLVLESRIVSMLEQAPSLEGGTICDLRNDQGQSIPFADRPSSCGLPSSVRDAMLNNRTGHVTDGGWFPRLAHVYTRVQPQAQSSIRWTLVHRVQLTGMDASFRRASLLLGLVALASTGICLIPALMFARKIARPLSRLCVAADDIANGYWDTLLPDPAYRDEIWKLNHSFRSMSRQLKSAQDTLLNKVEDLRRSQDDLTRQSERLTVTLGSIGDAVIASDAEGRIALANPIAKELLESKDLIGQKLSDVVRFVDPASDEDVTDWVSRPDKEHQASVITELFMTSGSGVQTLIELTAAPILSEDGTSLGAVWVLRDVGHLRKATEESNRIEKMESLGVLAGGIAHDFNNLLSVILGDISLLQTRFEADHENAQLTQHASEAVEKARGLTRQLLSFSKGGMPVKQTASLRELVEESTRFTLHGSSCSYTVEAPGTLWTVMVDPAQTHQVFHNLSINAIHAMNGKGSLKIRLSNEELSADDMTALPAGQYVRVDFSDQGPGIPMRHLNKIFDPYFTTKSGGSGLGLSSVHSIMQSHGGSAQVSSSDQGTTFSLYFPASPDQKVETHSVFTTTELPPPASSRVLVMDDEPAIRITFSRILEHLGHQVTAVETGELAFAAWKEAKETGTPFDLLICDLTVQGGQGGCDLMADIRKEDQAVLSIVTSGYSQDDVLANYETYGFNDYIRKPFSIEELQSKLSEVLNRKPSDESS